MLTIVRSFLKPRSGAYNEARSFARARRYIDWRRHVQNAPRDGIGIGDRPGLFAVLIEAWRYRNRQAARASDLESTLRRLASNWFSRPPADASPEFAAGYEAAMSEVRVEVHRALSVELADVEIICG